jgi:hypothetical protein
MLFSFFLIILMIKFDEVKRKNFVLLKVNINIVFQKRLMITARLNCLFKLIILVVQLTVLRIFLARIVPTWPSYICQ